MNGYSIRCIKDVQRTAISNTYYTIRVRLESNAKRANKTVARLTQTGYDAYSVPYTTTDNRDIFHINIGSFGTREEAVEIVEIISKDLGISVRIIPFQK